MSNKSKTRKQRDNNVIVRKMRSQIIRLDRRGNVLSVTPRQY
jgi:hypothetical protein